MFSVAIRPLRDFRILFYFCASEAALFVNFLISEYTVTVSAVWKRRDKYDFVNWLVAEEVTIGDFRYGGGGLRADHSIGKEAGRLVLVVEGRWDVLAKMKIGQVIIILFRVDRICYYYFVL